MDIHREPNLVIFRIPDDPSNKEHEWDNGFRLVEIPYLNGELHEEGTIFLPHQHDMSYRSLELRSIVLARKTAEGANELSRYSIAPGKGNPEAVYLMSRQEMIKAVNDLVKFYNSEQEAVAKMQALINEPKLHAALLKDFSEPYSLGVGLNASLDYGFTLQLCTTGEFWLPDGDQQFTYDGETYLVMVSRNHSPPQAL